MKYETLKEKIQSMTAKEIILAMVAGLENPEIEIDMDVFGRVNTDGVCFGCAATATVCVLRNGFYRVREIVEFDFDVDEYNVIRMFENAIDSLRKGNITNYNLCARLGFFAVIEDTVGFQINYPYSGLQNDYTDADLDVFRLLAFSQPD